MSSRHWDVKPALHAFLSKSIVSLLNIPYKLCRDYVTLAKLQQELSKTKLKT